ncbi:SH3 domain-containing protein [Butyrivibrio sp. AE2032]|uniref:SH3 domain-containing protein n=1 Tax=Butyrivibrio sp. AE2032 TaxID=1458463 RepID=UPI000555DC25|nr:SH3 domain-containing protein [Butyrivibrio sp. AE2032]
MKKREKNENSSIFKGTDRKNKPVVGEEVTPKTIRHIERPVKLPFLTDLDEGSEQYGSAEDMQDKWGLSEKQATLGGVRKRKILSFAIAFAAFILLIVGVFYILPRVLPGLFEDTNIELFVKPVINYDYNDEDYRVVTESTVAIMTAPDPGSVRIAEVLYNEPVKFVGDSDNGYCKIKTRDGIIGYVKASTLIKDMNSIEPDVHQFKLIVSDPSKNVMTHASNGTLIKKVMMNTVLYADIKREGVYQVALPGGDKGWIGSSGVIELSPRAETEEVSSRYFVSSVLTFVNSKYIENGMSINGASVNGVVYVCAEINGIQIPRTMEGQSKAGTEVIPEPDAVTGQIMIDQILPGDILFLSNPKKAPGDKEIYEMAVCTDTGTLFMLSPARTTVRLRNFQSGDDICDRIITIRRVFSSKVVN